MASLLANASGNTVGTGQAHTGPATVHLRGDSALGAGSYIEIQTAVANTPTHFEHVGETFSVSERDPITVNCQGDYYLRAVLYDPDSESSGIYVDSTN